MTKFDVVKKYADSPLNLIPQRATADSAGYDFVAAEDTLVPSYKKLMKDIYSSASVKEPITMEEMAVITKTLRIKPTLVPTGVKAYLPEQTFLQLSVRSSGPLKHWLIMANGVGIIDKDYADNPDNEGLIFFQLINLSPFDIEIKAGDKIGQGIILPFYKTEEDSVTERRLGGFGSTTK